MSLHPEKQTLETSPALRSLYREKEHWEFAIQSPLIDGLTRFRLLNRITEIVRILNQAVIVVLIVLGMTTASRADTIASYYTRESCKREGTSGIMANNRRLDDAAFTCASWDYVLGSTLLLASHDGKHRVVVVVSDRGPNEECYKRGITLDLTRVAFSRIAKLEQGHTKVDVQLISGKRLPPKIWRKR